MKYIQLQRIFEIMERKDQKGRFLPFDVAFRKISTGEMVVCRNARLSSIHSEGMTLNIIRDGETKPIKIYKNLITSFNGLTIIQ